jgi:hypothetical protein
LLPQCKELKLKAEVQEVVLKALNERIAVPGKVICMLHPWDAPVPLTRVWCLCRGWELHCAIKLGAEVIICFSSGGQRAGEGVLRAAVG